MSSSWIDAGKFHQIGHPLCKLGVSVAQVRALQYGLQLRLAVHQETYQKVANETMPGIIVLS